MAKPLLAALLLVAALSVACTNAAEETTRGPPSATRTAEPTPTSTQPPGGAGGGGSEGTVVPITPFPSPEPVPADWATYADPQGRFTLRYPPTWELETAGAKPPSGGLGISVVSFFSYDRGAWTQPYFPPNSVKVEVHAVSLDADVAKCGDPEVSSSPSLLGGAPAWETLTVYDTAADYPGLPDESKLSRFHQVAADHDGYRFCLVALFAGADPDETAFLQIVDSFKFAP